MANVDSLFRAIGHTVPTAPECALLRNAGFIMSQNETRNRRVVLAARPAGAPGPANFRLETSAAPQPADGELLLRTLYLSLDPYMRGMMNEIAPVYTRSIAIG